MARSPFLSLSPDLDLEKAFEQIETQRQGQVAGAERVGSDLDTRMQGLYGQLTGSLQQGVKTTEGLYDRARQNTQQAYEQGTNTAAGASQDVQSRLSAMAQQLGLDPKALAEVSGRLGQQAAGFQQRNQTAMSDRMSTLSQQGAGMSAVSQFAVQAAQQAMAQGRADLAKKVMTEVQRANTAAAGARTDFTGVKASQAAQAAAAAEKEAMSAMKQLVSEQNRASRSSSSRSSGSGSKGRAGSPYADRDQEMQEEKHAWALEDRNRPLEDDPYDVVLNEYMKRNYGGRATQYIEARLKGKSGKDLGSTKGLDIPQLETSIKKLKAVKYKG